MAIAKYHDFSKLNFLIVHNCKVRTLHPLKNKWDEMEIKKNLKTPKNDSTMYQNLCEMAKIDLIGKFIAINAYTKKNEDLK